MNQSGYNPDPHRHPGLHVIALLEASKAMLALLAATGLEVLGPQPLRHGIMALIRRSAWIRTMAPCPRCCT